MKLTWIRNGKKETLLETKNIAILYRHKSIYDQIARESVHDKEETIKDVHIS
jgi:hypothetical protein